MTMRYLLKLGAAWCLMLFITAGANAQQKNGYDLYLLIGQSNMAGRGKMSGEYATAAPSRVLMLNKDLQWVQARHPLHFDKPKAAGVGPGLSFAAAMARQSKRRTIGLIPCAVGGTSINAWAPGAYDKATNTHPYDDMLVRLQEAMKSGTLRGVIWLQGESNSSAAEIKTYLARLQELIQRVRDVAGNQQLPFVAGELGTYKERYQHFNTELAKLPQLVAYTALAPSEGLTHNGDTTHFDAASADEFGKRFAVKMKQLQKRNR